MTPLRIRVKPGSSRDEVSFDTEGQLTVKIREKPIDGAANDYLIKFLSKEFGLPKSSILLEKGSTSRFKKISLNVSPDKLQNLLARYR
jgi:uncharacterized protein (TIGR00251 family)